MRVQELVVRVIENVGCAFEVADSASVGMHVIRVHPPREFAEFVQRDFVAVLFSRYSWVVSRLVIHYYQRAVVPSLQVPPRKRPSIPSRVREVEWHVQRYDPLASFSHRVYPLDPLVVPVAARVSFIKYLVMPPDNNGENWRSTPQDVLVDFEL